MIGFAALRERLPVLGAGDALPALPRIGRGGAPFSDDVALADGSRLAVRVRLTDTADGRYCIDLSDSDDADPTGRFALSRARTRDACLLALGRALGLRPAATWLDAVDLVTVPGTWVDDRDPDDLAALAFGMARTYDAVLGAFGHAWPSRVGAGSCTLGAVVQLRDPASILLTEVLPGGEGGQPNRPGASAWPGPILAPDLTTSTTLDGLTLEHEPRTGSGGGGKQPGGEGIIRRYLAHRPLVARLAFDRVRNPPHGIDRAGPPWGTVVQLHHPDFERPRPIAPFTDIELPAGSRLEVHTCGGAGWGFPGYGEIEWDPSEWFGSDAKS